MNREVFKKCLRVLGWTVFGLLTVVILYTGFLLDGEVDNFQASLGGLHSKKSSEWLPLTRLDHEVVEIARDTGMGDMTGYIDAWLVNQFVPEDTRIELNLQGWTASGLDANTSPEEFLCMVFGCQYQSILERLKTSQSLSSERLREIELEADRIARGKTFWNCSDVQRCSHHLDSRKQRDRAD